MDLHKIPKKELVEMVKELRHDTIQMVGVWKFTLENVITGEKKVQVYRNIIPTVGLTLITNNLTESTPDNDILISHAALGDDVTVPALIDTILGNEVYRNDIASRTNAAAIAYATAFFDQTETTGTYKEAAIFCDGDPAPDTGILLSHVPIDVTKTNVQKLTIDWILTLSNA